MKRILIFVLLFVIVNVTNGQPKNKLIISAHTGYSSIENGFLDGFQAGLRIDYIFNKYFGFSTSISHSNVNTFPGSNGKIPNSDANGNNNALLSQISQELANGSIRNYYLYSMINFDISLNYYIFRNSKNLLFLKGGARYTNQGKVQYIPLLVTSSNITMETAFTRFSGFGWLGGIGYNRYLFSNLWASILVDADYFDNDWASNSLNISLSVGMDL